MAQSANGNGNGKRPARKLRTGQKAPDFRVKSDTGEEIALKDYRGKKVVLYFYPKDNTPGCTQQSCDFSDGFTKIRRKGGVVLGVSPDSVSSHKYFRQKHSFKFPLLSDINKDMVESYGVWKKKSLYGRQYMGVERSTFIINEDGKIQKIFASVKVAGHFEEVLAAL